MFGSFSGTLAVSRHDGNEPVASLGNRLDVLRTGLIVAERPTQIGDGACQRRLGDESTVPDGIDQFFLRNDSPPVFARKTRRSMTCGSRWRVSALLQMRLRAGCASQSPMEKSGVAVERASLLATFRIVDDRWLEGVRTPVVQSW
jgi:hypothetical protein